MVAEWAGSPKACLKKGDCRQDDPNTREQKKVEQGIYGDSSTELTSRQEYYVLSLL